jgi:hypothetical protein
MATAYAEEMETEHDRLFKAIYRDIPKILKQQGVQFDDDFLNRFNLLYGFELTSKWRNEYGYKLTSRSRNRVCYTLKSHDLSDDGSGTWFTKKNKINGSTDLYVKYDKLTPMEKANGVCYICGLAIPGNRTVKKLVQVPKSGRPGRCQKYAVHVQCYKGEHVPHR